MFVHMCRLKEIKSPRSGKKVQLIAAVTEFLSVEPGAVTSDRGTVVARTDGLTQASLDDAHLESTSKSKEADLSEKAGLSSAQKRRTRRVVKDEVALQNKELERASTEDASFPNRRSKRTQKEVPQLEDAAGSAESTRPKRARRQTTSASSPEPVKKPPPLKVKSKSARARQVAEAQSTVEITEVGSDVINGALIEKKKKTRFSRGYGLKGDVGKVEISQSTESWTHLVHKKAEEDWKAYDPGNMRPPPPEAPFKKIVGWNVNGLRAVLRLERQWLDEIVEEEKPDIICLQETKIQV
jgi:hypothetical protein